MVLIVEDGTGLPNANSFVELAAVDLYIIEKNLQATAAAIAWALLTTDEQEAAATLATSVVSNPERFDYVGIRKTYPQSLEWPRLGAVEVNGPAVPDDIVPWQVEDATIEYSLLAGNGVDINPPPSSITSDVKKEKVDDLEITYFTAAERGLESITGTGNTYPSFGPDRLLYPLLRDDVDMSGVDSSVLNPGTPFWSPERPPIFYVGLDDEDYHPPDRPA